MELEKRINILKALYAIHDEAVADDPVACGPGCSVCCTCNVTCTTLEGWLVFDHLRLRGGSEAIARLVNEAPMARYRPVLTLNHMVDLCVRGKELPDEVNDPDAGHCPWLVEDLCSFYEVRPFGCRAMLSTHDCRQAAAAQMPPFVLSLNNVIMQYLEAFDRPGGWGNLIDVLDFFTDAGRRRDYENRVSQCLASPLLANRTVKVLMVPPEHRQRMRPLIERVQAAMVETP